MPVNKEITMEVAVVKNDGRIDHGVGGNHERIQLKARSNEILRTSISTNRSPTGNSEMTRTQGEVRSAAAGSTALIRSQQYAIKSSKDGSNEGLSMYAHFPIAVHERNRHPHDPRPTGSERATRKTFVQSEIYPSNQKKPQIQRPSKTQSTPIDFMKRRDLANENSSPRRSASINEVSIEGMMKDTSSETRRSSRSSATSTVFSTSQVSTASHGSYQQELGRPRRPRSSSVSAESNSKQRQSPTENGGRHEQRKPRRPRSSSVSGDSNQPHKPSPTGQAMCNDTTSLRRPRSSSASISSIPSKPSIDDSEKQRSSSSAKTDPGAMLSKTLGDIDSSNGKRSLLIEHPTIDGCVHDRRRPDKVVDTHNQEPQSRVSDSVKKREDEPRRRTLDSHLGRQQTVVGPRSISDSKSTASSAGRSYNDNKGEVNRSSRRTKAKDVDRNAERSRKSTRAGSFSMDDLQNARRTAERSPKSIRAGSFSMNDLKNARSPVTSAMKDLLMDIKSSQFTETEIEQRIVNRILGTLNGGSSQSYTKDALRFCSNGSISTSPTSAGAPQHMATIVLTDVQGSTSLWEANPKAMQEALDLHDKILRRYCSFNNGYEIDTEGDAFFLAFHNPVDAFGFALATQSALFDTVWSKEIMANPAANEDSFKGLRVRMGVHRGSVNTSKNEVTGRTQYFGEAMNICKCIEGMSHGGQILTDFETWNAASYNAETDLGSPQVVDLGDHLMKPKGHDVPVSRRIIQLVPASLAFDYFAARSGEDGSNRNANTIGRQFDPPCSYKQVSASFHDAPHKNNEVTIAFVYFSEIEKQIQDSESVITALLRLVGDLLFVTPGYHSQSNMLAFPDVNEAVTFGLRLINAVQRVQVGKEVFDLSKMIKMGCVHDKFSTMGPHKTTGRADYFGKVVNRAARITAESELGTINFGVLGDNQAANFPVLSRSIISVYKGLKQLKGVQGEMALYQCKLDTQRVHHGSRSR